MFNDGRAEYMVAQRAGPLCHLGVIPHPTGREAVGAEAQAPWVHQFCILYPSECIFGRAVFASWGKKLHSFSFVCFTSGKRKSQGLCLHRQSSVSPARPGWLPFPPHRPELCLANISARVTIPFVPWWTPAQRSLFWVLFYWTMYVFLGEHTLPSS